MTEPGDTQDGTPERAAQTVSQVWLVTGYDVGGNGGYSIERVFDNEPDAQWWAEHSPNRKWNNTFWPDTGRPFDVEEYDVERLA